MNALVSYIACFPGNLPGHLFLNRKIPFLNVGRSHMIRPALQSSSRGRIKDELARGNRRRSRNGRTGDYLESRRRVLLIAYNTQASVTVKRRIGCETVRYADTVVFRMEDTERTANHHILYIGRTVCKPHPRREIQFACRDQRTRVTGIAGKNVAAVILVAGGFNKVSLLVTRLGRRRNILVPPANVERERTAHGPIILNVAARVPFPLLVIKDRSGSRGVSSTQ